MECKELIEELRFLSGLVPEQMCDDDGEDACEKAAAFIEAALEDLRYRGCDVCKYENRGSFDYPCCHCEETGGMSDNWEWRGPQKAG